jgi:hypothetical protein
MRDSNKKFRLRLIRADERRLSNPPLPGVARKPSFGLTLIVTTLHSKHIAQISVFAKALLGSYSVSCWLLADPSDSEMDGPLRHGRA